MKANANGPPTFTAVMDLSGSDPKASCFPGTDEAELNEFEKRPQAGRWLPQEDQLL
jgi:hypothetical protein